VSFLTDDHAVVISGQWLQRVIYGLWHTVKKPKGFTRDNKASWDMVIDKKAKETEKVYGIMVMQAANAADSIEIVFTNPCTYVRVGSTHYKKCY